MQFFLRLTLVFLGLTNDINKKDAASTREKKSQKKKCLSYAFACRGTRLAEMERFELSSSFPSYTISNRAPSTGLGDISKQVDIHYTFYCRKNQVFFYLILKVYNLLYNIP